MTRREILKTGNARSGLSGSGHYAFEFCATRKEIPQTTDHRVSGFPNGYDDYSGTIGQVQADRGKNKTRAIDLQFSPHDRGNIDRGERLPKNVASNLFCG